MAEQEFKNSSTVFSQGVAASEQPLPEFRQTDFNPTGDDQLGAYRELGEDHDIYTDYQAFNRYEYDYHIYMAGVTSPTGFAGQSAAFFQLAAPTLLRVCDWTACKYHSPPECPNPDPDNTEWMLLDVMPETAAVAVAGDAREPLYRLTGKYVYGHKAPKGVFSEISFPLPPYLEDIFNRKVSNSRLMRGLIDGGGGQAGNQASPGSPFRNQ